MAVFTKLSRSEIEDFISFYNIGKLENYEEIIEGIENTNYKILCDGVTYILTIFEKRVKDEDLPFFIELMLYLNNNNFECPKPLENRNGLIINKIKNKKAVIITFIQGNKLKNPNIKECKEVGKMLGSLHNLTINFNKKRDNSLDINEWKNLYQKCQNNNYHEFEDLFKNLKNEITFLEESWPKISLPNGVVHADLFKDNIFFLNEKITGIIDFYFSCNHFFIYDISIVINDWCFDKDGRDFKRIFFDAIIDGYNSKRKLEDNELKLLNILLRAAAVRILITRLHDYIFHPKGALVIKKDPYQYYNILKWHQNHNLMIK